MSNLFVPGQPSKPRPGSQIIVTPDGTTVLVTVVDTMALSPDEAAGLASAIGQAAEQARAVSTAIVAPITSRGVNGQ